MIRIRDRYSAWLLADKALWRFADPTDMSMLGDNPEYSYLQITDVRVRKITKEGKMKAVVSITLDDEFVVHDIKVIEGEKGLFIAMPSKKATDGEYRDIAHPINSSTRENLQKVILESYEKALEEPEEAI